MKSEQFVIVTTQPGRSYDASAVFHFAPSEVETLAQIASINDHRGVDGTVTVERVFKFDEYGNVTKYEMVLEGFRPKLQEIPQHEPRR